MTCDRRGLTILLDALAALRLLIKDSGCYSLGSGVADVFIAAECTRVSRWRSTGQLYAPVGATGRVVKTGRPRSGFPASAARPAIGVVHRGHGQHVAPVAEAVVQRVRPVEFRQLLDIGGASGTWTIAFLRACPSATAVLFDLPPVIPMADRRLRAAGLRDRVQLIRAITR